MGDYMKKLSIMGILVDKRTEAAPKVQEVLTKYGDSILLRVGLHDPGEEQHGLITLNVRDKSEKIGELTEELESLDGVQVKTISMK
jgi:putative iron-only hydrogenase system regulator